VESRLVPSRETPGKFVISSWYATVAMHHQGRI
jgi:hypothetical protein